MPEMKLLQYLQVLLLVAGIAYLVWFHLLNPSSVGLPFPVVGPFITSASLVVLGGFLFGLLYAALLFGPHLIRRSNMNRKLARRVQELEAENAKLKPPQAVPTIPDRAGATLEDLRNQGQL
jgi:hypothetical protein